MSSLRLDKALVAAGLVSSRTRAGALIAAGDVTVDGRRVTKASASVHPAQCLAVQQQDPWVSRAAHKLLGALDTFAVVDPKGRRCLDAGASTGGFTQVLLSRGADHVVAVDVGHDQMADQIRNDPRVTALEGTNLRYCRAGNFGELFDLIVADLSFISLRLVLEALAGQAASGAELLLMVKPQFEIGRERLGRTGVVTSPQLRQEAVVAVAEEAQRNGLLLQGAARSPLAGQDGNAEFFLHLRRSEGLPSETRGLKDRLESVDYHDQGEHSDR